MYCSGLCVWVWFVGHLTKVAGAGSMARSARHFDLALATTEAVARKSAARIFTGVCVGRGTVRLQGARARTCDTRRHPLTTHPSVVSEIGSRPPWSRCTALGLTLMSGSEIWQRPRAECLAKVSTSTTASRGHCQTEDDTE